MLLRQSGQGLLLDSMCGLREEGSRNSPEVGLPRPGWRGASFTMMERPGEVQTTRTRHWTSDVLDAPWPSRCRHQRGKVGLWACCPEARCGIKSKSHVYTDGFIQTIGLKSTPNMEKLGEEESPAKE